MHAKLSPELTVGAIIRGNEYAWELTAFPHALERAPSLGYACLGGQFWFLLPDNTLYEFYWLEANSSDRAADEPWSDYASRSCQEVLRAFDTLGRETDFSIEAGKFDSLESATGINLTSKLQLMFNAYFITEAESSSLLPGV